MWTPSSGQGSIPRIARGSKHDPLGKKLLVLNMGKSRLETLGSALTGILLFQDSSA